MNAGWLEGLTTRILRKNAITAAAIAHSKGSLIIKNGKECAGVHLLIDYFHALHLSDPDLMKRTLVKAAEAARATVLHVHLHRFEGGGVSGVAVLAESHISVHTWPEHGLATFDIFMCGQCDPHKSLPVLNRAFTPEDIRVQEFLRGHR
jgi:S-adenosylmethionine decarboxylase